MAFEQSAVAGLAAEAYVYGYPLVTQIEQMQRYVTTGVGSSPAAPWNSFSHARRLAGPADKFVTINNDTVYSLAQLDLGAGPLRLTVPPTGERYFVLQFVDAWTNNFAYIGRRASGGGGGRYLVAGPDWDGRAGQDETLIRSPTRLASIVGRFACYGPDDIGNVAALQDQTLLTPAGSGATSSGAPAPADVPPAAGFYEKLRCWGAAFPPSPPEAEFQQRFAPLGVLDSQSPYPAAPDDLLTALAAGEAAGKDKMEQVSRHGPSKVVNGWTIGMHMFDYNLDHFGPGTIDTAEWKIPDRAAAHLERAVADRLGLWGNHGYEAVYCQVFTDDQGGQLTGGHTYTIRFAQDPPVDAFWSITMYDIPSYYLVDNPIGRYSIGDRTPGIIRTGDGGLTVVVSLGQPADATGKANWLPAPDAAFRLVLRMYQPRQNVLDGTYEPPPVQKTS